MHHNAVVSPNILFVLLVKVSQVLKEYFHILGKNNYLLFCRELDGRGQSYPCFCLPNTTLQLPFVGLAEGLPGVLSHWGLMWRPQEVTAHGQEIVYNKHDILIADPLSVQVRH